MNYAEYGLDTTKKSKDDDVVQKDYWCLWCNKHHTAGGHFSLCFCDWVICKSCATSAFNIAERWEETDYCFKCKKPGAKAFSSHPDIANKLHICE